MNTSGEVTTDLAIIMFFVFWVVVTIAGISLVNYLLLRLFNGKSLCEICGKPAISRNESYCRACLEVFIARRLGVNKKTSIRAANTDRGKTLENQYSN